MTNRDRILIGALACLVAVAGFWFLALKPKRADAAAATARVAEAQTKLTAANQALASATSARASFQTDYAIAARLGKAVPDDDDAASLVFQLESAARKAGIDFRSLTVGGASGAAATTPAQPELVPSRARPRRAPRTRPRRDRTPATARPGRPAQPQARRPARRPCRQHRRRLRRHEQPALHVRLRRRLFSLSKPWTSSTRSPSRTATR